MRMKLFTIAVMSLLLFTGVACQKPAPGSTTPQTTAVPQSACDRACLEKYVDQYMDAMLAHQPSKTLFTDNVRFTENGVQLPFGNEGLWASMVGKGTYKFYIPDVETQQVAFIGTAREETQTPGAGKPVAIALRLKIQNGLISEAEHGTVFGLTGQRGPTAQELKAVQDACMGGANLMRHCRQCRADAVGLLGEDRSEEFTLDKIEEMEIVYDLDKRKNYQDKVEVERQAQHAAKQDALAEAQAGLIGIDPNMKVLVAVATEGHGRVNLHFGHATEFQIFEVSAAEALFVGLERDPDALDLAQANIVLNGLQGRVQAFAM